jgi:TRAP-type C4-dicarboxylate transport system permease small subunit
MSAPNHKVLVGQLCRVIFLIDDAILNVSLVLCGIILIAMVLIAALGIVFRFVLNSSLAWSEELDAYLFIWLTCLGAGAGIRLRAHPEVRIVVDRLPQHLQKYLSLMAYAIVLTLGVVILVNGGSMIGLMGAETATSLPVSMVYPYLAVPVGGVVLIIHSASHMLALFVAPERDQARTDSPGHLPENI